MELFEGFRFVSHAICANVYASLCWLACSGGIFMVFFFQNTNCHEELEPEHIKSRNIHDFGHLYRHRLNPTAQTIFTRKNVPVFEFLPPKLFTNGNDH